MKFEAQECKTPIVFIIFNRPENTRLVFQRIAQVRPSRLLIIADGPRADRSDEAAICQRVRDIAMQVNWPCDVMTNFSETNLGCRERIITGLNWAFEHVEEAIILEDDILPDPSFFKFCDEMLARFRDDSRISMISGFNIVGEHPHPQWSYFYSQLSHIWGWATWRRSWAMYDEHLRDWPLIRAAGLMKELFPHPAHCEFWTRIFDQMHNGTGPNTWDYQWAYTNLVQRRLSVTPGVNLVENIGFGPNATHTHRVEDAPAVTAGTLVFPLIHPPAMIPLHEIDELDGKLSRSYVPGLPERAAHKLKRIFAKIFTGQRGSQN